MKLYFPISPKAIQSVKSRYTGSFIQHYQPTANTSYKGILTALAINQLPESFKPLQGAIRITAKFIFPTLKSMKKSVIKSIEEGHIFYKVSKPDLHDNLLKPFDAFNGILWEDDSQIVQVFSCKCYGLRPGIELEVEEVKNG